MHYAEIIEHNLCSIKLISDEDIIFSDEKSNELIPSENKLDFWRTIARKHRAGIYIMGKKFLKKRIYSEYANISSSVSAVMRISVNRNIPC